MAEILLVVIGFLGAFASGLLGIGGGVVLIPMALYLPSWFGVATYAMGQVVGMSMVQVLAGSLMSLRAHARRGLVPRQLAVPLGASVGFGAVLGGLASGHAPEALLRIVFAGLAIVSAVLMFVPAPKAVEGSGVPPGFRMGLAVPLSFFVGLAAGLVGIGGGVLMIPLLTTVFRLPIRLVIGTSLAAVLMAGLLGTLGKAMVHQVPWREAFFLVVGALAGAPLGANLSHRLPVGLLRKLLAATILVTALQMVYSLIA